MVTVDISPFEAVVYMGPVQPPLTTQKSITLPRPSDQLWIVTDG